MAGTNDGSVISGKALARIRDLAERAYPAECCALLLGNAETDGMEAADEVWELQNSVPEGKNSTHFAVDPLMLYNREREAGEKGLRIKGFVHSHPDCPAIPSEEDKENMIPGNTYLIASVVNGETAAVRTYTAEYGGRFEGIYFSNIKDLF